jgi:hypothetical protein
MSNSATAELIRMPEMQRIVDGIVQFHQTCDKESNALFAQPVQRDQCSFDPMNYFALLPRLQPPAGRVLDWLYVGDRNGKPFLYWRDSHVFPHTSTNQLDAEPGRLDGLDAQEAITSAVQADGSAEGWVQLVLFRLMVGLTMMRWHATYKSVTLLCSPQALQARVEWQSAGWHDYQRMLKENPNAPTRNVSNVLDKPRYTDSGKRIPPPLRIIPLEELSLFSRQSKEFTGRHMPPSIAAAALALDVVPTVDLHDANTVRVCITRFSESSGFYRQTWIMNRQGPHELKLEQEVLEVKYHNGLTF